MSWDGYWSYDQNEIVNINRTAALARAMGLSMVRRLNTATGLSQLVGDGDGSTYSDVTEAPWYDPTDPDSQDFAGIIPVEIRGVEDSTRSSEIFEYTVDGGSPGNLRHSTKEVTFSLALIARTEAGAEYGSRWLNSAVSGLGCDGHAIACSGGSDLVYTKSRPSYTTGDVQATWRRYARRLRRVQVNRGPLVTGKRELPCGVVWTVSMTAVAGDPFQYSLARPFISGLGLSGDPYVGGAQSGWSFDNSGATVAEVDCPAPVYAPLYDPNCPVLVPPPAPPNLSTVCSDIPTSWRRRFVLIPGAVIPRWDELRPTIRITPSSADARMIRLSIIPESSAPDECGYTSSSIVTYIPVGYTLVIDSVSKTIRATAAGLPDLRADSLVVSRTLGPVEWASLSCSEPSYLFLDQPVGSGSVSVEMDLTTKVR